MSLRLFAALALPDDAVESLVAMAKGVPCAQWRPRENLHLTLRFFGEVNEPVADELDAALDEIASGSRTFEMKLKAVGVLLLLLVFGQRIMRQWFHVVARQKSSELFMLNVLLMTLGLAYFTELAGLSLALGAFVAGMLIAETEYRYQVEEDIKPFRDVLLGLFLFDFLQFQLKGFVSRKRAPKLMSEENVIH